MLLRKTTTTSLLRISVCVATAALVLCGIAHARTISGRVTDQDTSAPIVGTTVTANSSAASYIDSATTDDDGYYTVHGLPPAADFIVSASASGYLSEYYYEVSSAFDVSELTLTRRFQCIIGPNGSGKSNLMDAISFGLGVASKSLRSAKEYARQAYGPPRGANFQELIHRDESETLEDVIEAEVRFKSG